MMEQPTVTLSGNEDEILFHLELMVARRADRLAGTSERTPSADRRSWRQAEEEIFGAAEPELVQVAKAD
jgi:hypothetical protein